MCSFEVHSFDVAAMFWFLLDFFWVDDFGDCGVEGAFVKCPLLDSACGLDKCCEIAFWDMQA
jgi:hypothetical protein